MPAITLSSDPASVIDRKQLDSDTSAFGYITELEIGGHKCEANLELFTPEKFPAEPALEAGSGSVMKKVVGVISSFNWSSGTADNINITFVTGEKNKTELLSALNESKNEIKKLKFVLYAYDSPASLWYVSLVPKDPVELSGRIPETGGKIKMSVSTESTQITPTVNVYTVSFPMEVNIAAEKTQFAFEHAWSSTAKKALYWGGKVV